MALADVTVLYFADTRFPIERANGVQTMATCHALAGRGHDVTLVVRPDTAPTPRDPFRFYGLPPEARLHVRRISARGGARRRRLRFLLSSAAAAIRTSGVVYTRDLGLAAFLLRLPAALRPRVVYESHGLSHVVAAELPRLLGHGGVAASPAKLARLERRERLVWARARAYVTITQALAQDLRDQYGERPGVFVVPDAAHAPAPRPASTGVPGRAAAGDTPAAPVAVYAGHLYPWKGVDIFIRALARVPGLRGLVVGGHPAEPDFGRIEALVRDLGLASRVRLTGLVPPDAVGAHLTDAAVLVLPNVSSAISERYTSPLKLFEYLAAGRPIVASDLPSVREVLTHGTSAWLVTPGDAEALAAGLDHVVRHPDLASRLAAAARALAPQFTWAARAARLDAALEVARA